jgi:hypothetical protein
MPTYRATAAVVVCLLAGGCSFSASSESSSASSESSSNSSASSSRSSSPARGESYRNEVRDYTASYVKSSADAAAFQRGLAGIAARHGVTNWEADQDTWVGIGAGLRRAKVSSTDLEVWKTNLSGGDPTKAASMQQGYDAEH